MAIKYNDFNSKLENYLVTQKERLVSDWLDIVRIPSISSTGDGVSLCCDTIVEKMKNIGLDVTVYPVKPYPAIFAKYGDDPKKKTVLIYAHYDVQPADPIDEWKTPPFEPTIIDGIVYGRGTSDNKGPLMAHLKATEFWLKNYGELPVNIKFIFEGCEENSSLGLPEFLNDNRELLQADLVYFSDGPRHESGLPTVALGAKGMLYLELTLESSKRDAHSMYAPILPNAAWELIQLLYKLKNNGEVKIPGFYDNVQEISELESEFMRKLPNVVDEIIETFGVEPVIPPEKTYYEQLLNMPTFNISGFTSGYTGEGGKTVLPSTATAKIDIRLVANQSCDEIYEKLVNYIEELGYDNVEIVKKGGVEPSKTPIETKYLPLIEKATRETFGEYIVYPCRPSTAPDYLWTNILELPAIQVRWCDADSGNHAPNEKLAIDTYIKGIECTSRVIRIIGEEGLCTPL